MSKQCRIIQKTVSADPTLLPGFEKHGNTCPQCRAYFSTLKKVIEKNETLRLCAPELLFTDVCDKIKKSTVEELYNQWEKEQEEENKII